MARTERPLAVINSAAPIRICDNGGWTDTWFAGHGQVFNIAVTPSAEAQIVVRKASSGTGRVVIHPANFGSAYEVRHAAAPWGPHPLLEAAIALMQPPADLDLDISIHSKAPPGAGTGTSAAVTVALVGALDALTAGRMAPHEVAAAAQRVETEMLGRQCGIQDQLASACGGINFIEMFRYPEATVTRIDVPDATLWELERRLVLVYLGRSHDSSAVHESVIRALEDAGPDSPPIVELRGTAALSRDALLAGDFTALGRAMIGNAEAQARLHPALIGSEARHVIEIARAHGAIGWKANGAGGEGGSLTLLCDEDAGRKRALAGAIEQTRSIFRLIPIALSRQGLRVWRQDFA